LSELGKSVGKVVGEEKGTNELKIMARISSLSEKPRSDNPRRLVNWLNPTGEKKIHSLVDKVYKLKNLELAWEKVKRNRGSGGVDGQSIDEFEINREENLKRLYQELSKDTYQPQPTGCTLCLSKTKISRSF